MSGYTTPERDAQLLAVGKQCSDPTCMLVDFLPFKCQHCDGSFCGDHFLPDSHKCDKYDATKHDRVAPSCPLCNEPVAIPPGQDVNVRMDAHITSECSVMTGRTKKSSGPICAKPKCRKVLFAPIRCDECKQQFCPQHRFPNSHTCSKTAASSSRGSSAPAQALFNVSSQASAASTAAMTAIKRAAASTNTSATTTRSLRTTPSAQSPAQPPPMAKASSSSSSSRSTHSNPFSQQDRSPSSPISTSRNNTTSSVSCATQSNTASQSSNARSFVPPPLFATA